MSFSVPQLHVYYIDFSQSEAEKNKDNQKKTGRKIASIMYRTALSLVSPFGTGLILGSYLAPEVIKSLDRLIKQNMFNVITSQEELNTFTNANENEWFINNKSLKKKQYYIGHPKKNQQKILIEANDFYNYIENEQTGELVQFIKSHCPAKTIKIDRIEVSEKSAKANGNIEEAELSGSVRHSKMHHNCISLNSPNGFPAEEPRENYYWIDKSIKQCIESLVEGASFDKSYKCDFTFGLSVKEAKTLGLSIGMHKNFSYTVYVKC